MRNEKSSLGSNLGHSFNVATLRAVAAVRLLARCVTCYMQIRREYDELAQLGRRSLRDIGLTPYDVQVIVRRPIWRRCWQSVRACPNKRCPSSSICRADCRLIGTHFSQARAITKSDIAIK
jgi:uncharacterized protein YjiS (DUF1127 family)